MSDTMSPPPPGVWSRTSSVSSSFCLTLAETDPALMTAVVAVEAAMLPAVLPVLP